MNVQLNFSHRKLRTKKRTLTSFFPFEMNTSEIESKKDRRKNTETESEREAELEKKRTSHSFDFVEAINAENSIRSIRVSFNVI